MTELSATLARQADDDLVTFLEIAKIALSTMNWELLGEQLDLNDAELERLQIKLLKVLI
jgi:hypothetical protein